MITAVCIDLTSSGPGYHVIIGTGSVTYAIGTIQSALIFKLLFGCHQIPSRHPPPHSLGAEGGTCFLAQSLDVAVSGF